jgi:hypothetical protein
VRGRAAAAAAVGSSALSDPNHPQHRSDAYQRLRELVYASKHIDPDYVLSKLGQVSMYMLCTACCCSLCTCGWCCDLVALLGSDGDGGGAGAGWGYASEHIHPDYVLSKLGQVRPCCLLLLVAVLAVVCGWHGGVCL